MLLDAKKIVDDDAGGILMTSEEVQDMGASEEEAASIQALWDALDEEERQAQMCARSLMRFD